MKRMIAIGTVFLASTACLAAQPTSYQNFYITYMSSDTVKAAVQYAQSQGVNHFFMWTVDQDVSTHDPNSLTSAINAISVPADPNSIATYYPNYAAYADQRALPGTPYMITDNMDLTGKLGASNELIYAFAETQVPTGTSGGQPTGDIFIKTPNSYGAVYFYDPWSDLNSTDSWCNTGVSGVPQDGAGNNLICHYAYENQGKAYGADFGNFEAFSALTTTGKDGKPIQKYLSIGGFGHNATFEAIFDPASYGVTSINSKDATANFVSSIVAIIKQYNLDGVDMDYENVAMTHSQSQAYYNLLYALNGALQKLGKYISLPVISNPDYLNGSEAGGTIGFAPGVLAQIANLSQVTYIDPMTYDFSGNFNYQSPTNPGTTGFLTNTYNPTDTFTPAGYNFSIENVLDTLKSLNIPMTKVGIGIPSYGRALANLPSSTTDSSYLFSTLSSSVVVPASDQDNPNCDTNIQDWQQSDACQGMFSYRYLLNNISHYPGVVTSDHTDDKTGAINGTTAFGSTWAPAPVAPPVKLEVTDTNPSGQFQTLGIISVKTSNGLYQFNNQPASGLDYMYCSSSVPSGDQSCMARGGNLDNMFLTPNQTNVITSVVVNGTTCSLPGGSIDVTQHPNIHVMSWDGTNCAVQ